MGRDRSPSGRDRRRDKERRRRRSKERRKSRSRSRDRRKDRSRSKSRDRSAKRSRTRSRSPSHRRDHGMTSEQAWDRERERLRIKEQEREARKAMEATLTAEDMEGKTEEEIDMMRIMGFKGFDTTKGKKVKGNDVGSVHVVVKRKYRQYMNRKGGFNRPLDYVH